SARQEKIYDHFVRKRTEGISRGDARAIPEEQESVAVVERTAAVVPPRDHALGGQREERRDARAAVGDVDRGFGECAADSGHDSDKEEVVEDRQSCLS